MFFHPVTRGQHPGVARNHAKAICGSCPVRIECLNPASTAPEPRDMWDVPGGHECRALRRSPVNLTTTYLNLSHRFPQHCIPTTVKHCPKLRGRRIPADPMKKESSLHTRHIARGLFSGWQITNTEGQHTARIAGTRHDALECAHRQLAAVGGGRVTLDDHGDHDDT